MSNVNSISAGAVPVMPQPAAGSAGTIPATGGQVVPMAPTSGSSGQAVTPDQVQKAVDRMNQHLAGSNQSVRIGYVSQLHRLTVEVVDNSTGQVVGQFPSKAVINSEIAMNQYIGMILNKEA